MQKLCDRPLKQNPFTTYRDPETGKWVVVGARVDKYQTLAA